MSPSPPEQGDFPTLVFNAQPEPQPARVRSPSAVDRRLRGVGTQLADPPPSTPTVQADQSRRRRYGPPLAKAAVLVAVAALAMLLLRAFVIQLYSVPGDAMAPTLQSGDRILVLKSGLLEGPIHRGQIIVFHAPQSLPCTVVGGGGDLVLRVVALPGDAIWSVGDTIFVDGRPLAERGWYNPRFGQIGSTPIRSTRLAPGQYFMLADNRADACDSRVFGPISKSSVVGEGIAIVGRQGHVFLGTL
jgi:signal peptidase I